MKMFTVLILSLFLSACTTYQPVKSPCQENTFGKTKINAW